MYAAELPTLNLVIGEALRILAEKERSETQAPSSLTVHSKYSHWACLTEGTVVRLDRLQVVSWAPPGHKPPSLDGFVVTRDSFVRSQTTTSTYARCCQYKSVTDDTKIYWQYSRRKGWLKPWKITIVADDSTGLSRDQIERVLDHCRFYRFLTIEVALDFGPQSAVNREFVKRHAQFGKSRRRAQTR